MANNSFFNISDNSEGQRCHDKFLYHCGRGYCEAVKSYLNRPDAKINYYGTKCQTGLIRAVIGNHFDVVKVLVDFGANLNFQKFRGNGYTALIYAVKQDNIAIVELLVDAGANANIIDHFGKSVLAYAVEHNNVTIAQLLLKAGVNVDFQDQYNGPTSLMHAVKRDCVAMVELLVNTGANVNLQNDEGDCALIWAAENGNDVIVKCLLKGGANPDLQNQDGSTALNIVAEKDKISIQTLINAGLILNAQNKINAKLPLNARNKRCSIWWMKRKIERYYNIAELLIEAGANVDLSDVEGSNPIIGATEGGHPLTLQRLISVGGDVEAQEKYGTTPLMCAAQHGIVYVNILLSAGADVHRRDHFGRNALHYACLSSTTTTDVIERLLDVCNDSNFVNVQTTALQTPLIMATENGCADNVAFLLKHNADKSLTGRKGKTAFDIALDMGTISIMTLLSGETLRTTVVNNVCPNLFHPRFRSLNVKLVVVKNER